jgi:3-hydroxybutyryl-CoA dehydrogenase
MRIETVAVVGASEAGTTCAVLAALAGCAVRVFDASDATLERAFEAVRLRVELAFSAGLITRTERQRTLDGVLFTPDLEEALTGADLAVASAGGCTAELQAGMAGALRATAVVAAAGGCPPEELAAHLPQPGRVLSLALADVQAPVPRLELRPAPGTTAHALARAAAFARRVNAASRLQSSREDR